jgi:hypothetical protein
MASARGGRRLRFWLRLRKLDRIESERNARAGRRRRQQHKREHEAAPGHGKSHEESR